jgi:hypothetical protein
MAGTPGITLVSYPSCIRTWNASISCRFGKSLHGSYCMSPNRKPSHTSGAGPILPRWPIVRRS